MIRTKTFGLLPYHALLPQSHILNHQGLEQKRRKRGEMGRRKIKSQSEYLWYSDAYRLIRSATKSSRYNFVIS